MKKTGITLAVAMAFSGPVLADSMTTDDRSAARAGADFHVLDRNGDGYVSRSEAETHQDVHTHWSTLDRDADGRLDSAEFARFEVGAMPEHPLDKATGHDLRPGVTTEGKKN